MRWQRWRTFLSEATTPRDTGTSSPAKSPAAPAHDDFLNFLARTARARGFDPAEQLINVRTGRLWARLSMVAEPLDPALAVAYAERYRASVDDWIAWLQRPTANVSEEPSLAEQTADDELAALLKTVTSQENVDLPPLPNYQDRLLRTVEWRAKTEGFPAAEALIASDEARCWMTLSRFYQHRDAIRSLAYARRSYEIDPVPTVARRLQQLLFSQGTILEAERLFRASLTSKEGELTDYEVSRLARLQGWKRLFVDGFPMPERRSTPEIASLQGKVVYYLAHSLPHSGAGYDTRSHGLLTGIQANGFAVIPCTRYGYPWDSVRSEDAAGALVFSAEDIVDGVTYKRLRTLTEGRSQLPLDQYLEACTRAFTTFARKERPSVIHAASNFEVGLPAMAAARQLGLPSIYEVRGLWEVTRASQMPAVEGSELYATQVRLETEAAIAADRVITITTPLKEELIRRGVPAERISVVPNCVDPDRFIVSPRDTELEQQLGLTGKRVIGYVGSFSHYEGLDHLLDALTSLIDQGQEHMHLLLVGGGASIRRLYELVQDLELEDYVTMTGHVPFEQVHRYYSLIDIAPFPRKPLPVTEMVSPLKPLEAMAMEKAVIVSNVAAMAEMVQDGTTGLVFEKGNIDSLASALTRLANDPGLCAYLGKNAREWVLQNRTWEQAGNAVAGIYRELIDPSSPKQDAMESEPVVTKV